MRKGSLVVVLVVGGLMALLLSDVPVEAESASPMMRSMDVSISISNSYAVTRVHGTIANPEDSAATATFNFQVPEEAFISNFSLGLGNTTHYGKVVPAGQAREAYDRAVSEGRNAGLLASRGRSVFSYSVSLKAGEQVEVGLVFEQYLRMKGGAYEYSLCLDDRMFGGARPSVDISSMIGYSCDITSVSVENYTAATTISRPTAGTASTAYRSDRFTAGGNYVIRYSVGRAPAAGSLTSHFDGRDTYFMHVFEPGVSELGGDPMPKQVIFVLDRSGSMSGEKMEQVKTAFKGILRQLRDEDTFNLVSFSTGVSAWKGSPVPATDGNIDAAVSEVEGLSASGSTNFDGALRKALDMLQQQENSAALVVMLTDGLPTAGETDKDTIRSNARSRNALGSPIYCLGFGNDVDFDFLKAISLESGARALRIYLEKDAADQIKDFFATVANPLMKDVGFTYYPGAETHILGGKCLYDGSQLVVVGRTAGQPSAMSVTVKGTDRDGPASFGGTYDLAGGPRDPTVARFFEFARISDLLDRITVEGPGSSLVAGATNLSVQHGFVTPYSSMLVDIGGDGDGKSPERPTVSVMNDGSPSPATPKTGAGGAYAPYGSELIPVALLAGLVLVGLGKRRNG